MKFTLPGSARLLMFIATTVAAVGAQENPPPTKIIGSTVFNLDLLPSKPTTAGISRAVVDAPTPTIERLEMHVTTLNPGQISHPPHHHPQEELILIKEGSVEASINGRTQTAVPGSLLFFASHDLHNAKNITTRPATYYVINFYTKATTAVRDQPAAEYAPAEKLRSSVINWDKLETTSTGNGIRRNLVDSSTLTFDRLEVHATTVPPGHPASTAHRHPWVQLVIMKEGTMEATVNGNILRAGAGSILFIASNDMQSMKNVGSGPATYFVFSVSSAATPKPTE